MPLWLPVRTATNSHRDREASQDAGGGGHEGACRATDADGAYAVPPSLDIAIWVKERVVVGQNRFRRTVHLDLSLM